MSHFIDQAMERAYHLRQAKRTQQALGELFHILALEPNHLEATMLIIHCYDDLDQYTNALPYAEKLVQLAPDLPHAHYLLGYVHYRLDNNNIAIQHYQEALRLDPEDANYYGSLSFVYMEHGDFEKALQYAEQGLQIDPENANCLNCRTRSLSRLGHHEASQDNLKEALATHPTSKYTHFNAGITLLEQGDFTGAEKHF
ncbi:MAG TPA: tetratricopeptide repeat protein, partial [Chitinophagales bacterium]|nr:tetratricopeptide repeat protein [Chitinophagales bacterium]